MIDRDAVDEQFEDELNQIEKEELSAEEAFMQGVPHEQFTDGEDDTTEELTEDDFHRFKDNLPSDWEG